MLRGSHGLDISVTYDYRRIVFKDLRARRSVNVVMTVNGQLA